MDGQWVGENDGSNNGLIVVDIDNFVLCPTSIMYRLYKRGGINGHSSETCSNGSWPTAPVEHRSEIDSAAGVTDQRALGGNLSEVCGECGAIDLPVRK